MTDRRPVRPGAANRPKRTKPAVASRIAIAGLSASAGFALVAAMEAASASDNVEFATVPADTVPTAVPTTVPVPPSPPAQKRIVRVVVVASPPTAATTAPSGTRPSRSAPSSSGSAPSPAPSAQPAPAPAPAPAPPPAPTTTSKSS